MKNVFSLSYDIPSNCFLMFRSAYESKLNEQQQAVQNLQEEHERLMTIKNQLMTLSNAQVHPSNVSQSGSKSFERSTREDVSGKFSATNDSFSEIIYSENVPIFLFLSSWLWKRRRL